jgi:F-type H+-transporting ATPase subunit b
MTSPNVSLLLIMVCFWVTMWIVTRFLVRPVGATLDERSRRVDGAQQEWAARDEEYRAAVTRIEAEVQDAARGAAAIRAENRQHAMDRRQEQLDQARASADERLVSFLDTLEKEAEAARAELRRSAEELGRRLAGRLVGRELRS